MTQRVTIVEKNPRGSYENVRRKNCILPSTIILRQWPPLATNKTRMRRVGKPPKKSTQHRKERKKRGMRKHKLTKTHMVLLWNPTFRALEGILGLGESRHGRQKSGARSLRASYRPAGTENSSIQYTGKGWERDGKGKRDRERERKREEKQAQWRRAQTPCERQTLTFWNCAYYRAGAFPAVRFPRRLSEWCRWRGVTTRALRDIKMRRCCSKRSGTSKLYNMPTSMLTSFLFYLKGKKVHTINLGFKLLQFFFFLFFFFLFLCFPYGFQ